MYETRRCLSFWWVILKVLFFWIKNIRPLLHLFLWIGFWEASALKTYRNHSFAMSNNLSTIVCYVYLKGICMKSKACGEDGWTGNSFLHVYICNRFIFPSLLSIGILFKYFHSHSCIFKIRIFYWFYQHDSVLAMEKVLLSINFRIHILRNY